MWWVEAIGYAGTSLTVAAWAMKTSMRLRIAGILSSMAFLLYGYLTQSYPVMIMEMILMPLNIMRLYEMMRLVSSVSTALGKQGAPDLQWLAPHMRRIRLAPQQILFSRGDAADRLFIVLSGEVMLTETGTTIAAGEMIGEAGLFDPGQLQAQTCRCLDGAEIGEIKQSLIAELYFQNPMFGYRLAQFAVTSMRSRLEARSYSSSSCAGAAAMPRAAM